MGWSGGSDLFEAVIKATKKQVKSKKKRKKIYRPILAAFEQHDWDNLDECEGLDKAYDEIVAELYPPDDD
jgi:hypothetical protein